MEVDIKEGASISAEALQRLYEHSRWAKGRTLQGIRVMLKNTDYHFSAWDRDHLVGFSRVLTDGIYRATLWDVVVHPEFQNRGVGERLIHQILSHPVLMNVEKFWLNTLDKFSFYEKLGFVRSDQGMVRINPNFSDEGKPR